MGNIHEMRKRPLPAPATNPQTPVLQVDEARQVAYQSGVKALEGIVRRVISLERTVQEQGEEISRLRADLLELRAR